MLKWKYQFGEKLDSCRSSSSLVLDGLGYYLNSANELEIRVQVLLEISVYKSETLPVIQNIAIDSSTPKAVAKRPVVVLFYGSQGDMLWDIAKKYNTSVKAIRAANNLDDSDTLLKDTMLLIPRRR
jgi:hypothetical protein